MTLLEIKTGIAGYLERPIADLTVGGIDLGLLAMNMARNQLELRHDFEFSRKLVTVSVNGVTGGSLETAVLYGTATPVSVGTIVDVGLFDDQGNLTPIDWTTVADSLSQQRLRDGSSPIPRYPTDALASDSNCSRIVFAGDSILRFPKAVGETYVVGIECYTSLTDWVTGDLTGSAAPWSTKAAQYLLWQGVIHCNHLFKQFVPRQEGNLPPPQNLADQAAEAFINWDIFRFEGNRQHSR